jgi:hypothetical protein
LKAHPLSCPHLARSIKIKTMKQALELFLLSKQRNPLA